MLAAAFVALFALAQPLLAVDVYSKDGTRLYAEARGDPSKTHLVLTHGFMSSTHVFDVVFDSEEYLDKFYMVRYDMRGYGWSDKPNHVKDYESIRFAEDFQAVTQVFNVSRPFVMTWTVVLADIYEHLGHGTIAGAINLAGVPTSELATKYTAKPLLDRFPAIMQNNNVTLANENLVAFAATLFYDRPRMPQQLQAMVVGFAAYMPQHVKELVITRKQNITRLFTEGRDLPYIYFAPEFDMSVKSAEVAKFLAPHFNNFKTVKVPKCGHLPQWEQFDLVKDEVFAFVRNAAAAERVMKEDHTHQAFFYNSRFAVQASA
ncbi:hypothetical protein BOTBODRAFT_60082 [Botryobasidium botryosum FD-172 SS1]|uniref:AB hydrolase-1 domain-containing protein n=1 Tax=Botryobasidium botryosum (strain FD-172 SS1) TaxID=930990 RepID=A0A067LW09_BOTB1|nr:hypothetical protein BOTBODRAFT_60082 [Botryobasidium botryosum FD-172 SS1]